MLVKGNNVLRCLARHHMLHKWERLVDNDHHHGKLSGAVCSRRRHCVWDSLASLVANEAPETPPWETEQLSAAPRASPEVAVP